MLTSLKSCRSACMWHCHHAAERDARFCPSRDVATQFAWFGLQHLGYTLREGLPFADPWCEGVERTSAQSAEGVKAARPHHHNGSDCEMAYSRLNACVRVNGGHFKHKFWASDFLLCFVCFIDTGFRKINVIDINMCKVLILCEMCYVCVWHFHTVWKQHNERVAGNSYANDFAILWRSCARNIMKIRRYL